MPQGFTDSEWRCAVAEAITILRQRATQGLTITYSELSNELHTVSIGPRDPAMGLLLAEISTEERASGRGLLSVIVVHKQGIPGPGQGFFELAESLGLDTSDRDAFWIAELKRVLAHWSNSQNTA
jgi:hypothetical protein